MSDEQAPNAGEEYALKEYFIKYMEEIKGLSEASIKHYMGALDTVISRYLKEKGLVNHSIFEIKSLKHLLDVQEILKKDPDFVALNEKGHRMYRSGLQSYIDFARGQWSDSHKDEDTKVELSKLDEPIPREKYHYEITSERYRRSPIIKHQVLKAEHYLCEVDHHHETFIVNNTNHAYMEGHHVISLSHQKQFKYSLDIYANVICLCPICHRLLHYGRMSDREKILDQIYGERSERLAKSGLDISRKDFFDLAESR